MNMQQAVKNLVQNILLIVISLLLLLVFFECIVFRFVFLASDIPTDFQTVGYITKYKPNQQGVLRIKNEIAAEFRINADGWNSKHEDYRQPRDPRKKRIAVIGDSFIEAFSVDYDKSVAEQLESRLGEDTCEVYRFGIGGAPLSQYLNVLRHEVVPYRPDLVIVNVVHNDFDESYKFTRGLYHSNYLKVEIKNGRVVREIYPREYQPRWYTPIRKSATWRFLHNRHNISFQFLKDLLLGNGKQYEANITIYDMPEHEIKNIAVATDYIFRQLKKICDDNSAGLLIVMDAARGRVHSQSDDLFDYTKGVLRFNRIVEQTAKKYSIDLVDLHAIFDEEFKKNGEKFQFENDAHWNETGHRTAAQAIHAYLKENEHLLF